MVHPDAVGVQRGRIREAGVELRQPGPECSAVRERIGIQVGTHGGWSLLPRSVVGDDALLGKWLAQPEPLVGEEEECLVFEDRAAEHTAKVILPLLRLRQTIEVHKPVLGVQNAIPEILEQCAVKSIGSGARHN